MNHRELSQELCGILNVHKPPEVTSRDVVNQLQRAFGKRNGKKLKIGHAGTLDPMATGVLLVAVGRATRLIPIIHEFSKTYVAGITLGQTSDTDDSTGQVETRSVETPPNRQQLSDVLQTQLGTFMQTPPAFSAVKVAGRRAYKSARAGEVVQIKPRPVQVHEIELLSYEFPKLTVRIRCASGTYIRSIARDIGQLLNVGGLMHELSRTKIGPYNIKTAITCDAFDNIDDASLMPVESAFESDWSLDDLKADNIEPNFVKHQLDEVEMMRLRHGRPLEIESDCDELIAMTVDRQFAARLKRCDEKSFRAEINWVPHWFARS